MQSNRVRERNTRRGGNVDVDEYVRPSRRADVPALGTTRQLAAAPRRGNARVDPHEILRRHQEKRRQEQLLGGSAAGHSHSHTTVLASHAHPTENSTAGMARYAPLPAMSASPNGEMVMDGRARQAALQRYRKSQLKPIAKTAQVNAGKREKGVRGTEGRERERDGGSQTDEGKHKKAY